MLSLAIIIVVVWCAVALTIILLLIGYSGLIGRTNLGEVVAQIEFYIPLAAVIDNDNIIIMAEGSSTRDDKFVQQLNFASGTLSIDWKTFKAQFEIFKVAKRYCGMDEAEKIANLLVLMGPDSVPIYSQFRFSDTITSRKKTLKNVIAMFDAHFEPVNNVIYKRANSIASSKGNTAFISL